MDVVIRLSRSKLKRAQPGAECRESGTFRSEWEVGGAIPSSTPNDKSQQFMGKLAGELIIHQQIDN
jgi:hypothetical protein